MLDPEKEEGVLLETFSVREADVMASLLAHYQSISEQTSGSSASSQCSWLAIGFTLINSMISILPNSTSGRDHLTISYTGQVRLPERTYSGTG